MFYPLKDPPQFILDALYKDELDRAKGEAKGSSFAQCPDCGVPANTPHENVCDVARCLNTKIQRLQCECGECGSDVWTGLWPGTQKAYEKGWVCFDTATNSIMFDMNRVAVFEQTGKDACYGSVH